jgi:HK97 family phage major capsid protein
MTTEKLHEYLRRRGEIAARMKAITKQEDELPEGEALSEDTLSEFQQLQVELAALEGRISRLEAALAAEASTADDGNGESGNGDDAGSGDGDDDNTASARGVITRGGFRVFATPARRPNDAEKGFSVARFMIAVAYRKMNGATWDQTANFISRRFHDDRVAKEVKALNTQVVSEGGALIPQDFMPDLIELLRARVVVRNASPVGVGMPLGNMTIPRLAGGASANYQGEMDDMSLTEEVFDDVDLSAKKLTAMVPVSNDLLRRSPIGIEPIIRDDLVETIARKEDIVFIRSDGSGKSPIGWRSLVLPANLITVPAIAAGSSGLDEVVAALSAGILTLTNGMSRMLRPHWFMAPTIARFIATRRDQVGGFYYKDEMAGGTLEGIPFSITQQIPTNLGGGNGSEIYLVDMADTIIADTMSVQVDMSDVAAYYGTDGDIVSTFQRDQSLFRVIAEHDFNMRHLQSLAILIVADWKFAGLAGVPGAPWSSQPLNKSWAMVPSAWPAVATGANPPPTLYDPGQAESSAFDGALTDNAGGGPYPTGPYIDPDTDTPTPNPPAGSTGATGAAAQATSARRTSSTSGSAGATGA